MVTHFFGIYSCGDTFSRGFRNVVTHVLGFRVVVTLFLGVYNCGDTSFGYGIVVTEYINLV